MKTIETYYLIDYENVGSDGLSGCKNLTETDHILIFFTKNARRIDMSEIADHGSAELQMVEVPAGKQSTDIHIGSYLGYLAGIHENKSCKVVIISKDTDYDKVIRFWELKTGIKASRMQRIQASGGQKTTKKQEPQPKKTKSKSAPSQNQQLAREAVAAVRAAGYDDSVANTVGQLVTKFSDTDQVAIEVHNALRARYTNYLEVYNAVRPVLMRKPSSPQAKDSKAKNQKEVSKDKKPKTISEKTRTNAQVMQYLSKAGYKHDVTTQAASIVVKNLNEKNGKQKTYRSIVSKFGQEKGLAIYNLIKQFTVAERDRPR